jgi:hypothetical protein
VIGGRSCTYSNVAQHFLANPVPLGGPGVIVELDEAKFGKRKYNKGNIERACGYLELLNEILDVASLYLAPTTRGMLLLSIICRWVLPGSSAHTDEWGAYNWKQLDVLIITSEFRKVRTEI